MRIDYLGERCIAWWHSLQRNQINLGIVTERAAPSQVVNIEILKASTLKRQLSRARISLRSAAYRTEATRTRGPFLGNRVNHLTLL